MQNSIQRSLPFDAVKINWFETSFQIQLTSLNVIMCNVIISIMWSNRTGPNSIIQNTKDTHLLLSVLLCDLLWSGPKWSLQVGFTF
jgi:hypothetical protein